MARSKKSVVDTVSENLGEQDSVVRYWLNEIGAAKKREKDWRKDGERILEIYSGKKSSTTPFNILFSNTETHLPAVYSAVPRPIVTRRFKDEDPLGRHASMAGQRVLEFLVDTNVDGYETYDEAMRASTVDALLPGRGITCIKYDAEIGELPTESVDGEELASTDTSTGTPYKKSELVCTDSRSWDRVYFGYAKKWSKVPWIAYDEFIDKQEAERLFGAEIAAQMVFTVNEEDEDNEDRNTERDKGERKTAQVYQVWDKSGGRKIKYVSPQFPRVLKVEDDPLELTGFFNCPKPLQFVEKSNDLMPVALYTLYENQAKELNKIQLRINRIVDAIKARGIYDSELGDDIAKIMKEDDNALVPADKSSSLAAEKGLQNAIWFMPLEQLVATLQQLYAARESCKQVIYEITGLADIMRGATQASETFGAQKLKSQWGTLRLKRTQKEVQRYARDLLRMMLEVAATKFSEDTWASMTGLPFVTTEERQRLMMVAMAAQQSGQQLDPQTEERLQSPFWPDVLAMLRDDMQRAYRIDIETNSTIEPEAAEDHKNITDLLTALGQYLQGVGPMVANGVMPFGAAQSMMLAISRRFSFGSEVEDYIGAMNPPAQKEDGQAGAAEAAKLDAKKQSMADAEKISAEKARADKAEAEKEFIKREFLLAAREEKLRTDREVFDITRGYADKLANVQDQRAAEKDTFRKKELGSVTKVADERVKQAKDVSSKIEAPTQAAVMMQATVEQMAQAMQQAVGGLARTVEQLTYMMAADSVPERDPKTNQVTRIRRVPATDGAQ